MPIKSVFFPSEALQGQDLPSHITWEEMKFDCIKVKKFEELSLLEIYNVKDDEYEIKNNEIIVKNVVSEGYLGMVFSTLPLEKKALDAEVSFMFILDKKVVEKIDFKIHLFRPDITLVDIPKNILVNFENDEIIPRILIKNFGEGTAIIDISTTPESEIQKHEPEWIEKFNEDYKKSVNYGIERLKESYIDYSRLLDTLCFYLINPLEFDESKLKEFENFFNELLKVVEKNEEFRTSISTMLINVILENSEYSSLYHFVSEYINSISTEKMLLKDPFNVIDVSKEKKNLELELKCIDLLNQLYTTFKINNLTIEGSKEGEIPLFKIFQWGNKT
ncbi:MAG: hypothetical protein ACTSPV_14215 [Candidatus Hodarchaeales archaeon]